jgi:isoaspartyl peptidase/L-asparaginase-like protein (Ntn-hydrolase superfamily)
VTVPLSEQVYLSIKRLALPPSTGVGEEVVRICGSHTVVELMRQGLKPEEACKRTVQRIIRKRGASAKELQVGFIAVNKKGEFGGMHCKRVLIMRCIRKLVLKYMMPKASIKY